MCPRIKFTFNLERIFCRNQNLTRGEARRLSRLIKRDKKLYNPYPTAICICVSYKGKRIKITSDIYVLAFYWDTINKRLKNSYPGHIEINNRIQTLEYNIHNEVLKAISVNPMLTIEDIRLIVSSIIMGKEKEQALLDFFPLYEKYIEEKQTLVKANTIKKLTGLKSILEDFQVTMQYDLSILNLNRDFDVKYRTYCAQNGRTDNTLSRDYDTIRHFMSWSRECGFHNETYFEKLKVRRKKVNKPTLCLDELNAIILLDLSNDPKLQRARDIFVFQTFTGQRDSDIRNLKWKDLKINNNGNFQEWILNQSKGRKWDSITIPILNEANKILRYYHKQQHQPNDKVFKPISNQKLNLYIKELCKKAGISSPYKIQRYCGPNPKIKEGPKYIFISTHTARRTFCTLCLKFGVPVEVIMSITGHSNYKTFREYLDLDKDFQRKHLLSNWSGKFSGTLSFINF